MTLEIPDGSIKNTLMEIARKRSVPWQEVALEGLKDWTESCGGWLLEDDDGDPGQPEFPSEHLRLAMQNAAHA
jgi:hypothetical protein